MVVALMKSRGCCRRLVLVSVCSSRHRYTLFSLDTARVKNNESGSYEYETLRLGDDMKKYELQASIRAATVPVCVEEPPSYVL